MLTEALKANIAIHGQTIRVDGLVGTFCALVDRPLFGNEPGLGAMQQSHSAILTVQLSHRWSPVVGQRVTIYSDVTTPGNLDPTPETLVVESVERHPSHWVLTCQGVSQ